MLNDDDDDHRGVSLVFHQYLLPNCDYKSLYYHRSSTLVTVAVKQLQLKNIGVIRMRRESKRPSSNKTDPWPLRWQNQE